MKLRKIILLLPLVLPCTWAFASGPLEFKGLAPGQKYDSEKLRSIFGYVDCSSSHCMFLATSIAGKPASVTILLKNARKPEPERPAGKPTDIAVEIYVPDTSIAEGAVIQKISGKFPRSDYIEVRGAFEKKYGKPQKSWVSTYQNDKGLRWSSENISWEKSGTTLRITESGESRAGTLDLYPSKDDAPKPSDI